jgi:tRNA(adenine34) deaminase
MRAAGRAVGDYRLAGSTLYVTLEPCIMCASAIVHARLERVVFGAWDPKAGAAGSIADVFAIPQLNHRMDVFGGVLAEECATLLTEFFRTRRP